MHLFIGYRIYHKKRHIERERISGSWRGYRHMFGLKVRGQRTRTTGRKGGAVGVAKGGKIMPTKGGAGAPPAEGDADAAKDATGDAAAKTDAAPAEEKKE